MFTIGKLAALAEVSADTLRYYEREGLVAPSGKSEGRYRLYDKAAADRIRFIKRAQQCGFTLAEIAELLSLRQSDGACCADVRQRALEKKLQLEAKIRTLQAMSSTLDGLIADCPRGTSPVEDCSILAALERSMTAGGADDVQ